MINHVALHSAFENRVRICCKHDITYLLMMTLTFLCDVHSSARSQGGVRMCVGDVRGLILQAVRQA